MDEGATHPEKPPQGWFVDPFGVHEQRWFSQGTPTALVRDGRSEAQDPPPEPEYTGTLLRTVPPHPQGAAEDDLLRADDRDREIAEDSQFDFFGDPARAGEIGMPTTAGLAATPGLVMTVRTDGAPLTPKRILMTRWVALAISVAWTLLLTGLLMTASTTTSTGHGHSRTQSVFSSDPGGVILFVVMLLVAVGVTGFGFVRRVRTDSVAAGRTGYVIAGVLGILGVLSLATIGLALIILAAALAVVARPLRRPRPLPGERVA